MAEQRRTLRVAIPLTQMLILINQNANLMTLVPAGATINSVSSISIKGSGPTAEFIVEFSESVTGGPIAP